MVITTTNAPSQRVRLVGFSFEGGGMRGNGLEFGEWGEGLGFRQLADNVEGDSGGIGMIAGRNVVAHKPFGIVWCLHFYQR